MTGRAGPTAADLAEIEAEWPVIAAGLDVLDAEIRLIEAGRAASPLDWRRLRRARRQVITARLRQSAAPAAGRAGAA